MQHVHIHIHKVPETKAESKQEVKNNSGKTNSRKNWKHMRQGPQSQRGVGSVQRERNIRFARFGERSSG